MTEPCPHCTAPLGPTEERGRQNPSTGARSKRRHLLVRSTDTLRLLKVNEIEWLEADGHHVRIRSRGEVITVRQRLRSFEEALDPLQFLRIHRSTIVNLDSVREFRHWFGGDFQVLLRDGAELRLSRHYRDRLRSLSLGESAVSEGESS